MTRLFYRGCDAQAVANFIVERSWTQNKPLGFMELMRYVYLAHGWTLGYTGKPLIKDPVVVASYGPIINSITQGFVGQGLNIRFKAQDYHPEFGELPPYTAKFTEAEIDIMSKVYDRYSQQFVNYQLWDIVTAKNSPWDQYVENAGLETVIPNRVIMEYYKKKIQTPAAPQEQPDCSKQPQHA